MAAIKSNEPVTLDIVELIKNNPVTSMWLDWMVYMRKCVKAGTKKAEQIHEYYINLEETLQEVIEKESNELCLQIENKSLELANK